MVEKNNETKHKQKRKNLTKYKISYNIPTVFYCTLNIKQFNTKQWLEHWKPLNLPHKRIRGVLLCGHDLLSFVMTFSVRFSMRELGRKTGKYSWQSFTVFMSIVWKSFLKNLLMTKFNDHIMSDVVNAPDNAVTWIVYWRHHDNGRPLSSTESHPTDSETWCSWSTSFWLQWRRRRNVFLHH